MSDIELSDFYKKLQEIERVRRAERVVAVDAVHNALMTYSQHFREYPDVDANRECLAVLNAVIALLGFESLPPPAS